MSKRLLSCILLFACVLVSCGAPDQLSSSRSDIASTPSSIVGDTPTATLSQISQDQPSRLLAAKSLVYAERRIVKDDPQNPQSAYTIWQVDLQNMSQRQKLIDIPAGYYDGVQGQLSPDGNWIAYRIDARDGQQLHVVRHDGSYDRLIAVKVIRTREITRNGRSLPADPLDQDLNEFYWSTDSERLTFRRSWIIEDVNGIVDSDGSFYVYNVSSDKPAEILLQSHGERLVGWIDATNILALIRTESDKPIQFEILDIITNDHALIAPLPTPEPGFGWAPGATGDGSIHGMLWKAEFSPDKQQVFLRFEMSAYIFDIEKREFVSIKQVQAGIAESFMDIWGPGGKEIINAQLQPEDERGIYAVPILTTTVAASYTVNLSSFSSNALYIRAISPDGKYMLIDESDGNGACLRSIMYDLESKNQQNISEQAPCPQVLGWMPQK